LCRWPGTFETLFNNMRRNLLICLWAVSLICCLGRNNYASGSSQDEISDDHTTQVDKKDQPFYCRISFNGNYQNFIASIKDQLLLQFDAPLFMATFMEPEQIGKYRVTRINIYANRNKRQQLETVVRSWEHSAEIVTAALEPDYNMNLKIDYIDTVHSTITDALKLPGENPHPSTGVQLYFKPSSDNAKYAWKTTTVEESLAYKL